MLANQLRDELVHLSRVLETDAKAFTSLVEAFAATHHNVEEQLTTFANSSNQWPEATSNIHSAYGQASRILAAHSYRTVFPAAQALQDALKSLATAHGNELAGFLVEDVHEYEKLLDAYIGSHSMEQAPLVLNSAAKLNAKLTSFRVWAEATIRALATQEPDTDEDSLKLTLEIAPTLAELVEKLEALQELTDLLQAIFRSLNHDVTYRLVKLETGSCYIELIARKVGIVALKQLILNLGGYFYRTRTAEGQLKHEVPLASAAIRDLVKLRNILKKEGIEVEGLDDRLVEQVDKLAQKVSTLIGLSNGMRVGDAELRTPLALPAPPQQPRLTNDQPNHPDSGSW